MVCDIGGGFGGGGGGWRGAKCCHGGQIDWQRRLIRKEEWETGGRRRAIHLKEQIGDEVSACWCHEESRVLFSAC